MTVAILIILVLGTGVTSEKVDPADCSALAAQAEAKSDKVIALCLGV